MNVEPILREALLTADELPGWSSSGAAEDPVESAFGTAAYGRRFIGEARSRLTHRKTGDVLVQHLGVLPMAETEELADDLAVPPVATGEMLEEGTDEAWAVVPLNLPPVGDQSASFRLVTSLPEATLLCADSLYVRRGRLAAALVRITTSPGTGEHSALAPLAVLADRKLTCAAARVRASDRHER